MAEAVTRLGDMSTAHGAWPARPSTSASPNVFVNGIAAHRLGDSWAVHCNPQNSCHDGVLSVGSPTVTVNGVALGRVNDQISCGSLVATGSPNVFSG